VRALGLLREYQRGSFDHRVSRSLPVVAWLDEARRANPTDIELAELTATAYRDFGLGVPGRPSATEREGLADACLDDLVGAGHHDPLVYLARHYYRTRYAVGDASADLAKALSLAPDSPEVLLAVASAAQQRARTLCESDKESPLGLNDFAKAVELYRRVIASSAEAVGPQPYLEVGDALLALGESAQALAIWADAREKFPDSRALFNAKLADAHLAANDPQQAAPCLDAIDLELNMTNTAPGRASLGMVRDQHLRRGLWLMQRERPRDAIGQFQRVITLQEQLGGRSRQATRAWEQLGHAFAALAKWNDAASAFDYACLEHPQSGELWLLASQAHLQAKHYDVAVERAHQAVRQEPSCIVHLNLAGALLQQQLAQPPGLRRWRSAERALAVTSELADDGTLPDLEPLESLGRDLVLAKAATAASASPKLSLWQWHHQEWPSIPAIHRLFATAERNRIEPLKSPSASMLSFESALQLSRVQAMRGEYDLAEEMLLQSAPDHSPTERAVIDREFIQHRLARGDVKEAHALLSNLVRASPDIEPLRQMAAEVAIEHDRRVRAEEEETFLP
jgi:tetratricopeptide (TPR) repeat protein